MRGNTWLGGLAVLCAAAAMAAGIPGVAPAQDNATRVEPIVVTATRIEQKVSEQASAVSVVTREEIDLKAPALAGDVLRGLPGIDVQRSGSVGSRENIKIRGGKSTNTLVMIDGFPVNSPTAAEFDISSLPVDGFERVEVVRGAQSALYGSNAMSGVVNFIPRRGAEGRRYGASLSGGSRSTLQWNGYGQGAGKAGSLRLGAGGFESEGFLANDDASLLSFLGTGEAAVGRNNRLHGLLFTTQSEKGIPIDFTGRDANHRFVRRGIFTGARWETEVSRSFSVEASGGAYDEFLQDTDPPDPGEFTAVDFTIRSRKSTLRALGRYSPSPVSTTIGGVEYVRDRATDRDNFGLDLVSSTYNRSVFVQEEFRPGRRTGISLGARLDRNSDSGTEFNPKAAAYHEFERLGARVRAAAGRGFRVPTILEKFDPYTGNPALSPEKAVSWEAGADLAPPGGKADFSATYFHQTFRGLIQFVPTGLFTGKNENVGKAYARGVEAQGRCRFSPEAEVDLSYTWTDTRDEDRGRRITGIPTQRGGVSLLLSPDPRWRGRIDWWLESDQEDVLPDFRAARRPGYNRVDAYARYLWQPANADVREVALVGKVRNLLNGKYDERAGIPAPGFSFLLGAEVGI